MSRDDRRSRRTVLRASGGTAVAALLAGCGSGGPGGEEENQTDTEPDGGSGGETLEPGEIALGAETQGWRGREPEALDEEVNPTLTLQEGESYEITWENLDGREHNLQILDDSGEVVDDYETEFVSEEGETRTLEIDGATTEMSSYICGQHEIMNGEIDVQ